MLAVFGEVEQVEMVRCRCCMPDEDNLPLYVCWDPRTPFEEAWPRFEHYD